MASNTMKELLEAGVHFGHQTKRWNPKMKQYIFGERNGIYIIDLQKTLKLFKEATQFVTDLAKSGNPKGLVQCGEDQRIAAGEFALQVFACNNRDVELLRRKGAPLNHVLLEALPLVTDLYWGVPKHSPHPNLAKLFAVVMWTPEAQEIMWEDEGFDLQYVKGSRIAKELQGWRARGIEPKLVSANDFYALGKTFQERLAKYLKILRGDS